MLKRKLIVAPLALLLGLVGLVPLVASGAAIAQAQTPPAAPRPEARSYLPLPEAARPPAFPDKGYLLDDLGGGLYGVRNSAGENSMFLVTRRGVVVVDAPEDGAAVKAAIAEVTTLPVTHFIYSHSHADHTGGAGSFATSNVGGTAPVYIAHELAAQRIRRANDPRRPVPTKTFKGERYVLRTGGQELVLDYHGDLHSSGDLFVYAPRQRVLMLVDVIAPKYAPYFHLGHTNDVPLYLTVPDTVLSYDFDTFIGGHAFHYGTRVDIEQYGRYLDDMLSTARQVFRENNVDYSDLEQGNAWAGSDRFYSTLAAQAAARMPSHWLTELAGAEIFLEGNMRAIMFSLWTDFPPDND